VIGVVRLPLMMLIMRRRRLSKMTIGAASAAAAVRGRVARCRWGISLVLVLPLVSIPILIALLADGIGVVLVGHDGPPPSPPGLNQVVSVHERSARDAPLSIFSLSLSFCVSAVCVCGCCRNRFESNLSLRAARECLPRRATRPLLALFSSCGCARGCVEASRNGNRRSSRVGCRGKERQVLSLACLGRSYQRSDRDGQIVRGGAKAVVGEDGGERLSSLPNPHAAALVPQR
jgi:hypothetical protein